MLYVTINVQPPAGPLLEPVLRGHLALHSYNIFKTVSIKPRGSRRHRWPSGEGRSLKRGSMNAFSQWAKHGLSSLGNTRAQRGQASLSSSGPVWKGERVRCENGLPHLRTSHSLILLLRKRSGALTKMYSLCLCIPGQMPQYDVTEQVAQNSHCAFRRIAAQKRDVRKCWGKSVMAPKKEIAINGSAYITIRQPNCWRVFRFCAG